MFMDLGLIHDESVGMRAISCSDEVNDSTVLKYDRMLTAISCITVSGTSAVFSKIKPIYQYTSIGFIMDIMFQ